MGKHDRFPTARIERHNGRLTIMVDDKPFCGMAFTPVPHRVSDDYIRRLVHEAGIKLWFPIIKWNWSHAGTEDTADAGDLTVIDKIYAEDPEALMIPRFDLDPPKAWKEAHPDDLAVKGNSANKTVTDFYSVASDAWWSYAQETLERLLARLHDHPASGNIVGLFTGVYSHTEGGGWSAYGERECYDFGEPDRQKFIAHLKRKYNGDFERVRQLCEKPLWRGWDDITQPEFEERQCPDMGMFHDPAGGGVYIREYRIYQGELAVQTLTRIGETIKQASDGNLLYGTFYGYCGYPAGTAANALPLALESPAIDFLAAPALYDDRRVGGTLCHNMPIDSIAARGKIFFSECDVRTSLAEPAQRKYGAPKSLDKSVEFMRLYAGHCMAKNLHGWWFEPGRSAAHQWYNHSRLAGCMRTIEEQLRQLAAMDVTPVDEIALVWDRRGAFDMCSTMQAGNIGFHRASPGMQLERSMLRFELPRIGAPVTQVVLEDVIEGRVSDRIKCFIFVNTWAMTANQLKATRRELETRRATELWFFAPGFVDRTHNVFSTEAMKSLTGLDIEVEDRWGVMHARLTDAGVKRLGNIRQPLGQPYRYNRTGLDLHSSFTPTPPTDDFFSPFFIVKEAHGVEVLGRYEDSDAPAFAYTECNGRRIYYSACPFAARDMLTRIAEDSGAHIYMRSEDVLHGNSHFLMCHTSTPGEKMLALPEARDITDDAGELHRGARSIEFTARAGETRFFFAGDRTT